MALAVLERKKDTTRRVAKFSAIAVDKQVATYAETAVVPDLTDANKLHGVLYYPSMRKDLDEETAKAEIATHRMGWSVNHFDAVRKWFVVEKIPCPYFVGQKFYLRENHWLHASKPFVVYQSSPALCAMCEERTEVVNFRFAMGAGNIQDSEIAEYLDKSNAWNKTPAKDLTENLSRCALTVTEVGLKRLQIIEGDDFRREGILSVPGGFAWHEWTYDKPKPQVYPSPLIAFEALWDSLHGFVSSSPAPWKINPCVWVVRFKATPARVTDTVPQFARQWFPRMATEYVPPALPFGA